MDGNDITSRTGRLLENVCHFCNSHSEFSEFSVPLSNLYRDFFSPCVLAVAGKVKAGKSSLINELLGVDLAMTGVTATTATVNIFKKGKPLSKDTPILCKWSDGHAEWKSQDFLNKLQGTSEEVLKITEDIDSLTFYIDDNPLLEDVTLVDTPGIGAAVGEDYLGHQIQSESYFGIQNRVREKHNKQTSDLSNSADAILYLFKSTREALDKEFLMQLYNGGKGITSLNGLGVLSQIDENLNLLNDIPKYTKEFEHQLFGVIPTSSALYKYLPDEPFAKHLSKVLKDSFTDESWPFMSSSESAFYSEFPGCIMSLEERKSIVANFTTNNDLQWTIFQLICNRLRDSKDVNHTLTELKKLSGIDFLRETIYSHFFQRSRLLRCSKILSSVKRILDNIRYSEQFQLSSMLSKKKKSLISSCKVLPSPSRELIVDILEHNIKDDIEADNFKRSIFSFIDETDNLLNALSGINDDFFLYQKVIQAQKNFSQEEIEELSSLFSGRYMEVNVFERINYWAGVVNVSLPNSIREKAANRAKQKYIEIYNNLTITK